MDYVRETHFWLYETPPVDWWLNWVVIEDGNSSSMRDRLCEELGDQEHAEHVYRHFLRAHDNARSLIGQYTNWRGDGRWRATTLPNPDGGDYEFLFAVKQEAAGNCFFSSVFRLPWLGPDQNGFAERHIVVKQEVKSQLIEEKGWPR